MFQTPLTQRRRGRRDWSFTAASAPLGELVFASLLLAIVHSPAAAGNHRELTIGFLLARQNPDGGYTPTASPLDQPASSSLRSTLAALRALNRFGGKPNELAATKQFVANCFDAKTGGYADKPGGKVTVPTTAVGVMAAVELKFSPEHYRDAAVKFLNDNSKSLDEIRIAAAAFESLQIKPANTDAWLRQIAATRNADGTFGTGPDVARATGSMAVTILRLGGTIEQRENVLKALRVGQRADGGFGGTDKTTSDLESCYRVMRAFAMLKERPAEPERLRAFVEKCRDARTGGYGDTPNAPPTVAATYYAAMVLGWVEGR